MRPLSPSDLSAAARMLLVLPKPKRPAAMAHMIAQAEAADRYRKRLGHSHPIWGNGSLEAAARRHNIAQPQRFFDTAYLEALTLTLNCLVAHRRAKRLCRGFSDT